MDAIREVFEVAEDDYSGLAVDFILKQSRSLGLDPIIGLEGMIEGSRKTIQLAEAAIERLRKAH